MILELAFANFEPTEGEVERGRALSYLNCACVLGQIANHDGRWARRYHDDRGLQIVSKLGLRQVCRGWFVSSAVTPSLLHLILHLDRH
jgi:hypothetical protein